jgi:Na+-transporting NADH:ubiquinone oxidoreductase subunit NqrA
MALVISVIIVINPDNDAGESQIKNIDEKPITPQQPERSQKQDNNVFNRGLDTISRFMYTL